MSQIGSAMSGLGVNDMAASVVSALERGLP